MTRNPIDAGVVVRGVEEISTLREWFDMAICACRIDRVCVLKRRLVHAVDALFATLARNTPADLLTINQKPAKKLAPLASNPRRGQAETSLQ